MKNNKLISELQMTTDELAYKIIIERELFSKLSAIQSICDFNVVWLHQVDFTTIRSESIDFLFQNIDKFKRKLSVREVLKFDSIIYFNKPIDFEDFKKHII